MHNTEIVKYFLGPDTPIYTIATIKMEIWDFGIDVLRINYKILILSKTHTFTYITIIYNNYSSMIIVPIYFEHYILISLFYLFLLLLLL